MKRNCLVIIILALVYNLQAEVTFPKYKLGKISKEELQMPFCSLDSGAHAMYLINDGYSEFEYLSGKGFVISHTRYFKIKVFDKEGDEFGNISIPYYVSSQSSLEEQVYGIKATTYNLVDGKVVKSKLSSKDIFKENTHGGDWTRKFAMPNVQAGSVIEVQYKIRSDFTWNLRSWTFQYSIPVAWSRYETLIPEFFEYGREMKGYITLAAHEEGKGSFRIGETDYLQSEEIMIAKDIPAFKKEPYVDAHENYISRISFELRSKHPPLQVPTYYTSTWEKVRKELYDMDSFGGKVRRAAYWDNEWNDTEGPKDTLAHIKDVYNQIQERVKWNKEYAFIARRALRSVLKEGSGNSAEINLMLVGILHKDGINVNPVCLKVRSSGRLPLTRPSLSNFNYVVAAVELGGKMYLLDATEDYLPFGMLPERCLNHNGVLFGYNGRVETINLEPSQIYASNTMCQLKIGSDGSLNGTVSYKKKGYASVGRRNKYDVASPLTEMKSSFEKRFPSAKVDSCKLINAEKLDDALVENYFVSFEEVAQQAGDMIFVNPSFVDKIDENPFKLEDRQYPVDFTYPRKTIYVASFEIPEGYKIEEYPENLKLALPNGGGVYLYLVQPMDNQIQVMQQFMINKSIFVPGEYANLKEIFNQLVSKQNEQIVLKKI